jgi:hypothetical protein
VSDGQNDRNYFGRGIDRNVIYVCHNIAIVCSQMEHSTNRKKASLLYRGTGSRRLRTGDYGYGPRHYSQTVVRIGQLYRSFETW